MNKVYNTVWNESTGMWVVTSELTRKGGRRPRQIKRTVLAGLIAGLLLPSAPALAVDYNDQVLGKGGTSSSMSLGPGDTATNTTINSGGQQHISSGGSATSTTINQFGAQYVSNGGSATDTTIKYGGQHVFSGGSATNTNVSGMQAEQHVYIGGSATNTSVSASGKQQVFGSATSTTVSGTGIQYVHSGGSATSTTINSGGKQIVSSGGSVIATTINHATQNVLSGGSATSTTINAYGIQGVHSGASATDTIINSDGTQYVSSGGSATDTTVNTNGKQVVYSCGLAIGTTILGGWQVINPGGSATDTVIHSGGTQQLWLTSVADTVIHTGGEQYVYGGSATDTTINGGVQYVTEDTTAGSPPGSATNTIINSGGTQLVFIASVTSTTINEGGVQELLARGSATDTIVHSGGTQHVLGGSAVNTTLNGGVQYVVEYPDPQTSIVSTGSATDTVINSGGVQNILGGSVTNTSINDAGTQNVQVGGSASLTTINNGGIQTVLRDGKASDTILKSGGTLMVNAGGIATAITQNDGGAVVTNTSAVLEGSNRNGSFSITGGSAANMLLENGGYLTVLDGHQASATTVGSGGTLDVRSGGVLYGTTTLTDKGTLVGDVVTNEGNLYYLNNSAATFTGSLTGSGILTQEGGSTRFSGLLSQDGGIILQSGGAMTMDALQAKANVTTQSGTTLTLDNGSILTGSVEGDNTGAGDMTVKGASVWHLDGDSTVGALTLDNGSVDFRPPTTTRLTPAFQAVSLALGSLSGSGTFRMNTDIAAHTGDMLKVTGNASGNFVLDIKNTGLEPVSAGAPLQVVQTGGGDAAFTLKGGKVDAGTWEYTLSKENTDWYLQADTPPPVTPPADPDAGKPDAGTSSSPVRRTTKSADAVLGMATAPAYVFNSELDNLRFRHGDVMQNTRAPGGVWGRYTGSDKRISGGASSGYTLTQNGFETGADKVFDLGESRLAAGTFFSYSDNSIKHARGGKSTVDSTGGGLYATWFDNDGYYVDGVIKFNRFSNELRTWMSDGSAVKGDYSQNGFGGSLEAGRTFSLNENAWAQPYVRTTAFRADAKDISLNNGMKASIGATKSLQTEAGVKLGMTLDVAGKEVKPYLSAAVSHEFSDNNKVRINDTYDFRNDISGTTGKYGLGVSAQLTPNAGVWAEARYENGKQTESPVTGSVGFRFNF
ncbi:autotransporter outer membrane beta-barrel domain-containing protein [Citrobacter sp. Cu233]|uniref:autotransporter outer membrane beta-barrel domain-containing protein n=1 Tax=Citrobacter sp. Cu233 TaxID=2985160 RepID=UPI002578BA5A|nr:autotransporter outer membrane beta-barrel domain-containing protein [Citrobacter sp. Cu233]MDM2934971.1 autotransporter outer membrane beta-barrel domain-containing protein [Citrobacter sp. Cu233]